MEHLNQALFGYFPYIALTVFFVGSLIRFDREQYTWRSGSSQILDRRNMVVASNLFHVGILGLLVGHSVGMLTPLPVFEALGIEPSTKQMMAICIGSIFGIMTMVGLTMLIIRRLGVARVHLNSTSTDIAILWMLLAQGGLGMISVFYSLNHLDGSVMVELMRWAQGIWSFDQHAASHLIGVAWVFKAHIVLGLCIILLFPFSRLVHVWSVPVWYMGRSYQIVRKRQRRSMVR
ncbi:MAG: respiratory nitrate reductase subunit gamma [Rhodospirillaceae bacterium]